MTRTTPKPAPLPGRRAARTPPLRATMRAAILVAAVAIAPAPARAEGGPAATGSAPTPASGTTAAPAAPAPPAAATGWSLRGFVDRILGRDGLPEGITRTNGRIEAERVEIAAKVAGKVALVAVEEGDTVDAGAIVARIDDAELKARLAGAQAMVRRAERARAEAEAAIAQRDSELVLAQQEYDRARILAERGSGTVQAVDQRQGALKVAEATKTAALASLAAAEAEIDAANADVATLQSQLADTVLTAPRRGRIEYKLVQTGEVVAAGAPVATLLDLTDVYMTIFLPASAAGRLALGDEARIVLDPIPQYVIPARVTFVAAEAQFTPKAVETDEEREKLMFRVKLRIDPALLARYEAQVKTGLRGVGYVRAGPSIAWPASLAVKLPER